MKKTNGQKSLETVSLNMKIKLKLKKKRDPEIFIETLDWMESVRL
jgi:hypothetical protein